MGLENLLLVVSHWNSGADGIQDHCVQRDLKPSGFGRPGSVNRLGTELFKWLAEMGLEALDLLGHLNLTRIKIAHYSSTRIVKHFLLIKRSKLKKQIGLITVNQSKDGSSNMIINHN